MTGSQQAHQVDDINRRILEEARPRFTPPYIESSSNPRGFQFQWAQLQYAFGLTDPAQFPPLPVQLPTRDVDAVRRYVRACKELSTYSLLNHKGGLTINVINDTGTVTVDQPPKEALRGFAVLFRQIHSDAKEPASYKVVKAILSRASFSAKDGNENTRESALREWARARPQLLQRSLSDICETKIQIARGATPEFAAIEREFSPIELISLFNYGEYIHWGDKRGAHAALFQDEISGALNEFYFQAAIIGLSHFYLGFSKLLETAFEET